MLGKDACSFYDWVHSKCVCLYVPGASADAILDTIMLILLVNFAISQITLNYNQVRSKVCPIILLQNGPVLYQ